MNTTLASPIVVNGDVHDGDIVVYDMLTKSYTLSEQVSDSGTFGVVVTDPVLVMQKSADPEEKTYPVVRFGEAVTNVSDLNGEIQAGDLVTTSRIVGVGQRMDRADSGNILGFALGPVTYPDASMAVDVEGTTARLGKVLVALRIGYFREHEKDVEKVSPPILTASTTAGTLTTKEDPGGGFDVFRFFRYLLGSLVALTAVVLALRRFGDLFAQSIISVGRNPLARSQIRSILVWNAILIVVVSSVGLGIGVAIIAL